jgi:AcrR family transcriptional regulator
MSTKTSATPSARDRLLAAANELFYEQGVHTVGIDRIIEKAGVAKASLYSAFGSKEALVRAYLESRHETRQKRLMQKLERYHNPRERLLGVFEALRELVVESQFRGCAFLRASAEVSPDLNVRDVCDDSRAWLRALFVDLARAAGAAQPARLAQQLHVLYDGATVGAQMDRDPAAAVAARSMAAALLDAATAR